MKKKVVSLVPSLSMGDREDETGDVILRRCTDHVWEDVIDYNEESRSWTESPSCIPPASEASSSVNGKAEESTSLRRDPRLLRTGYVVRDRKPHRHVPTLDNNTSREDEVDATPDFDVYDDIGNVGLVRDLFWPQPGDILVLQTHRSGVPYPGFDGHVELYVNDNYFDNPDYTWNWAYDFREGDVVIRFGKFSPLWVWKPEETVQVYLRVEDDFVLVGRKMNEELCPLDFSFADPRLRPIHSVQPDFHPRPGDLIIRSDPAKQFEWKLYWWKEELNFVSEPFDMLVRAGFENSDDNLRSFGVAEVYFRNAQNQHWSFQGRDDYTFGFEP